MDYVKCPNCLSKTWYDRIALGDTNQTLRFECTRCGKLVKLTSCSKCKARDWIRENNLFIGGGKKPIVRYSCGGCGRIIGLYIENG